MTTIEDELRDLFADPRYELPGWPDATARVWTGVRRRRRRRNAAVAVAATLALVAASGASLALLHPPAPRPLRPGPTPTLDDGGVVPWRVLPQGGAVVPAPSPRPVLATCRGADLVLDRVREGAAAGTLHDLVMVRNTGTTSCTLPGGPTLLGVDPAGRTVAIPVSVDSSSLSYPGAVPATVDPGGRAVVDVATAPGHPECGGNPPARYTDASLRLPDGRILPLRLAIDAGCGVFITPWYLPAFDEGPSPLLALLPSIQAPASVRVGTPLDFVVTLANPTGTDIPLDPCPSFVMGLDKPGKVGGAYQLNCAVPDVPAHGAVRFAMRLSIPPGPEQAGLVNLHWSLTVPGPGDAPAPRVATAQISIVA